MNYLKSIGMNAKKAFEDLKGVKHKKIKKVLEGYNQSLLKNSNKIIRENMKDVKYLNTTTEKDFKNESILYNIFSSLREKINSPARRRSQSKK